jgi:hypothetical protein
MKAIITSALIAASFAIASCAPTSGSGVKSYTSDKCVVSGNKLGSMGDPVTKVYGNQEVKFCCKPCVAKYEKNPAKYSSNIR